MSGDYCVICGHIWYNHINTKFIFETKEKIEYVDNKEVLSKKLTE